MSSEKYVKLISAHERDFALQIAARLYPGSDGIFDAFLAAIPEHTRDAFKEHGIFFSIRFPGEGTLRGMRATQIEISSLRGWASAIPAEVRESWSKEDYETIDRAAGIWAEAFRDQLRFALRPILPNG